jgi:hypothetical protein
VPKIKQAFEMKATRATLQQIHNATHLYSSLNSYKTFFENPLYIGILHFGDLTIDDYCEPVIDRPTWDAVQRILKESEQRSSPEHHPRRQAANYLLSGLIYCARCRSPLWGMSSQQRDGSYYLRYACTQAKRRRDCDFQPIPARSLERAVIARLHSWFEDPNNLADLLDADQAEQDQLVERAKVKILEKQKELRSLRKQSHRSPGKRSWNSPDHWPGAWRRRTLQRSAPGSWSWSNGSWWTARAARSPDRSC